MIAAWLLDTILTLGLLENQLENPTPIEQTVFVGVTVGVTVGVIVGVGVDECDAPGVNVGVVVGVTVGVIVGVGDGLAGIESQDDILHPFASITITQKSIIVLYGGGTSNVYGKVDVVS